MARMIRRMKLSRGGGGKVEYAQAGYRSVPGKAKAGPETVKGKLMLGSRRASQPVQQHKCTLLWDTFTKTWEGQPQAAEVRKEAVKEMRLWSHQHS